MLITLLAGSLIPVIFLLISIMVMNDYGETTDEKASQISGSYYYYQWGKQKNVEEYIQSFSVKDRNYGPFIDTLSVASYDILNQKYNLIKNPVASYHVPAIIASTLALAIVFAFAYVNWGIAAALLSSLTLAVMPRFIGDSQNNIKDTPILTLFAFTITLYYLAVTKKKLGYYILAGIMLGMTYATKINAIIIVPIIVLWFVIYNGRSLKGLYTFLVGLCLSFVSAFGSILLLWPYYRYKPLERFVETYNVFKSHEWNDYILYMGTHYRGHDVPREYPFVMFGITTPVFFLGVLFIAVCLAAYIYFNSKQKYHRSPLLLLFIWMLATPVIQAVSTNPMYDGIRHYQASLAPMAILIGFTLWFVGIAIRKNAGRYKTYIFGFYVICCLFFYAHIIRTDIKIHPYQIVYFNEGIGGVKGAYRKFDLDYWGQSLLEATQWIHANLPAGSRLKLTNYMEHHFPIDRTRFAMVTRYPQYKINLIRGTLYELDTDDNYLHPKKQPIHEIMVDGAPILQIFAYPENTIASDIPFAPIPENKELIRKGLEKKIYDNNVFAEPAGETRIDSRMTYSCGSDFYMNKTVSISYSGYLRTTKPASYCFHIDADDEAVLKLDNKIILISPTLQHTDRRVYLQAGLHRFGLEYVNDLANGCLMVQWATGTCDTYEDIPESVLFH